MTFGLRCCSPARRLRPASLLVRVPTAKSLLPVLSAYALQPGLTFRYGWRHRPRRVFPPASRLTCQAHERDRPGRLRRRPADATLRSRPVHPFGGNSSASLMIGVSSPESLATFRGARPSRSHPSASRRRNAARPTVSPVRWHFLRVANDLGWLSRLRNPSCQRRGEWLAFQRIGARLAQW